MLRLGVDIGGTNTDVAAILGEEIIGACKMRTREDFAAGVMDAIASALSAANSAPGDVSAVMLGTSQFTNAFTEVQRLKPSAILRVCLPFSQDIEPMIDWPADLKNALGGHVYMTPGGYEFDGSEASALDEDAILAAARDMRRKGLHNIAVSCIFSTINDTMEKRAAQILLQEIPDALITLSSRIGRFGLIDRENAALINASLNTLSTAIIKNFAAALKSLGIVAPFYVSQNDGSLMSPEYAAHYPVLTYSSGAANSIRGAAHLTRCDNAIVVDIGGTTTDVGVLRGGFPRERSRPRPFGGVRTNFRMPDILSVGLGGGSVVHLGSDLRIGPESVAGALEHQALVYGGDVVTATDIAVAMGRVELGDPARLARLAPKDAVRADQLIQAMIAGAIDRMKTTAEDVPVIIVGGGRFLAADPLPGASELLIPDHADIANAIGAAFALLSGQAEQVFDYSINDRAEAVAVVTSKARQKAVAAGADPSTLRVVDVEEFPLPYTEGKLTTVRVKVVGDAMFRDAS